MVKNSPKREEREHQHEEVVGRPWPHHLREVICRSEELSWPALRLGALSISHHVFLSLSIRLRDALLRADVPVRYHSRVVVYYADTHLSRLLYVCAVTALGMIGASFSILEEKMPRRARRHVVAVYDPMVLLDLSLSESQEVVTQLLSPDDSDETEEVVPALPVLRVAIDEHAITAGLLSLMMTDFDVELAKCVTLNEKFKCFDRENWEKVTKHVSISVTITREVTTPTNNNHDYGVEYSSSLGVAGIFWCDCDCGDIAFVDWTSGSSGGLPKGCHCMHSTLSNMLFAKYFAQDRLFGAAKREVVGVNLFNLWYWWQPICAGHTTALLLSSEVTDISLLFEGLTRMQVTAMDCITPSLLQAMLHCCSSSSDFYIPPTMIVGGEMLTVLCAQQFYSTNIKKLPHHRTENRLINLFSTTETGDCSYFHVTEKVISELFKLNHIHCPIGSPIKGISLTIDDVGGKGLVVGGADTDHYLSNPDMTKKFFDARGWLSHDQASFTTVCGCRVIMLTGRSDDCVKIRGYKVDLNAVEECIELSGTVTAVNVQHHSASDSLIAFVVMKPGQGSTWMGDVLNHPVLRCIDRLPISHRPQTVEELDSMPIGRTGKVDRTRVMKNFLNKLENDGKGQSSVEGHCGSTKLPVDEGDPIEEAVLSTWKLIMSWTGDADQDFWDLGGHSLLAMQLCAKLHIPSALLFGGDISSPRDMINYLKKKSENSLPCDTFHQEDIDNVELNNEPIAVIGMSGRWPGIGQASCDDLFDALKNGGFEPLTDAPSHTGVGNVSKGFYLDETLLKGFDCNFWKMTKDDATLCDPQLRSFLEMGFEALCDAGVVTEPHSTSPLNCGVFASSGSLPHYLELLLEGKTLSETRVSDPAKYFNLEVGNDKDYLATRLAYLLNMTGPAECVQSACSSSLVAISRAVDSIRNGACEVALAGGVSIFTPQHEHAFMPDLIWSHDGHCRPFDAKASGTSNCNGGHVFILKSLSAALRDGDSVYGCIKGSAVRNDGRMGKRNFSAPSTVGYIRTVQAAFANAGLANGSSIRMVEAHATGTIVGDPIEMAGIAQAYGSANHFPLSVGSVKGNVGHANTAAGAMSVAKSLMCIHKNILVPSGNFHSLSEPVAHEMSKSRRKIQVQEAVTDFGVTPRMAGISAMGIGGTASHLILEQFVDIETDTFHDRHVETLNDDSSVSYLPISATSMSSLTLYIQKLANHINQRSNISVHSLCSTLAISRPQLKFRKFFVIPSEVDDIGAILSRHAEKDGTSSVKSHFRGERNTVVLVFSGQGVSLPQTNVHIPQKVIDILGYNPLHEYWETDGRDPILYQLAAFAVQLGIGQQLVKYLAPGLKFVGLGHSLGEWVVAALSGLMTIEQATRGVLLRAKILFKYAGGGCMICVCASETDTLLALENLPDVNLDVACKNQSDRTILSGSRHDCQSFMNQSSLICKEVPTDCAYHSRFVDSAVSELEDVFMELNIKPNGTLPEWTVVSSQSGDVLDEAHGSPRFWATQARSCVHFVKAVSTVEMIAGSEACWILSYGISKAMCVAAVKAGATSVCNEFGQIDTKGAVLKAWEMGIDLKMEEVIGRSKRLLSLPAYQWDRVECWPQVSDRQQHLDKRQDFVAPKLPTHYNSLYEEAWLPLTKACPVKQEPLLSARICLDGWSDDDSTVSSPYRYAVKTCCDEIKTFGRLVISTCSSLTMAGAQSSASCGSICRVQCLLLSRFLIVIQAILENSDCINALRSALPHSPSFSTRGGHSGHD